MSCCKRVLAQRVRSRRVRVCSQVFVRTLRQPPENLQLRKLDNHVLDDAKKLADLKVENDEVIAVCYALAGEDCIRH